MSVAAALGAILAITHAPLDGSWRPPELAVAERGPLTEFEGEMERDALAYLGRPYVSGGVGSPGFDCSGFTCRVFARAGYAIPRVSRDQARVGRAVPLEALAPGDLLVFVEREGSSRVSHVGIYLGNRELIHAASGQGRVVISDLDGRWYRERLIGARRILPDPGAATSSTARAVVPVTELVEHDGALALPPMLRLPPDLPPPESGPSFFGMEDTSIGLRLLGATEAHRVGLVLAPELTLSIPEVALLVSVAAPIRFEPDRDVSLGVFDRPGDALKFIRAVTLGLRNAELELALTRFGDLSLARGALVSRHQPSAATRGITGLAVARTPLSFFGAYRGRSLTLEAAIDDVVDPGLFGAGAQAALIPGWLWAGAALASDQRAVRGIDARRAINGAEVDLVFDAISSPSFSVSLAGLGAALLAGGELGLMGGGRLDAEYRFAKGGTSAVAVRLEGARVGAGALEAPFGPTYALARSAAFRAIEAHRLDRFTLGGGLELRVGRLVLAGGHKEPVGPGGIALDRQSYGLLELRELSLLGSAVADLRVSWDARGLATPDAVDVLQAGLRLRIESWLYAEAYLSRGDGFEGGLGLTGALGL